ncbi:MAG: hypothetical protein NTW04_02910 [Elusimicrobia bacterium]|nr:hypothetical protein [Elusimicrobiota bacterium]
MRKILVAGFVFFAFNTWASCASVTGLGFDIYGSFFNAADSRFQGFGTGVSFIAQIDQDVTLGYRTEQMDIKGEDTGFENINGNFRLHSLIGTYRLLSLGGVSVEGGVIVGYISDLDIPLSSMLIEPMGRIIYSVTKGTVDGRIIIGAGYRFARDEEDPSPFGKGSETLENLDGFEINFGVGLTF